MLPAKKVAVDDRFDARSVAAIIVTDRGEYLLQLRESHDAVDFPGLWGLFGGSPENMETDDAALQRELAEELNLFDAHATPFATLVFDERSSGGWYCYRSYFTVMLKADSVARLTLHEGEKMQLFEMAELERVLHRIIPYDASAIMMHARHEESIRTLAVSRLLKKGKI